MPRLRLTESDRARFGVVDEWLTFERVYRLREAVILQRETGFAPDDMEVAIFGTGEGEHRPDLEAVAALVWLVLYRHGVPVPFATFDVEIPEFDWAHGEVGKDPST